MTPERAKEFAEDWIASWNSHDLDRILSHYTDGFEMNSPLIVQFMDEPSGQLIGKEAIRRYWGGALSRNPNLKFELIDVFVGASSVVIHYINQTGRKGSEVFFFDDGGFVSRSAAHYLPHGTDEQESRTRRCT